MKTKNNLTRIIHYIIEDLRNTDFFGVCYQMAFYLLLSFFPLILFLINFVSKIIVHFEQYLFDFLKIYLPKLSYQYVTDLILFLEENIHNNNYFLLFLTFILASMAARAIMIGINQNYNCKEERNLLKVWLYAFIITLFLGIAMILIASIYILLSNSSIYILEFFKLEKLSVLFTRLFPFCFAIVFNILLFTSIYTLAPTKKVKFKDNLPGSIFATFAILIVLKIFIAFINHSKKYTMIYGSLGGLFALLFTIYFICIIVNAGCKLNVYYQNYKTYKNRL